jgi:hypothetical protein
MPKYLWYKKIRGPRGMKHPAEVLIEPQETGIIATYVARVESKTLL